MKLPPDNSLRSIKNRYHELLDTIYGKRETDNVFMLVAEHYFGWKKSFIIAEPDHKLSESEILKFHLALKELAKHKPVQYVLGETVFFGLTLKVNESVLIPRPETEELVQLALDKLNQLSATDHSLQVLDCCTGSGCIALALEHENNNLEVYASDVSPEALKTAMQNAAELNLKIEFLQHDLLVEQFSEDWNEKFHLLISNPPYVLESDKNSMHPNVLNYEPHLALFVEDHDPLLFYRALAGHAKKILRKKALLIVEIHENLATETEQLFSSFGFQQIEIHQDLQGKNRMISAVKC